MKKIEWDSHFFNRSIYEINLDTEQLPINLESAEVLYVKSQNDFDLKIEGFENTFEENKIVFVKELVELNNLDYTNIHSLFNFNYSDNHLQQLRELSLLCGVYSRFLLDPKFGIRSYEKLYIEWIEKSINKELAREIFIYLEGNNIIGFITVYIKNNEIAIGGLSAIDKNYRGKGIGRLLFCKLEDYLIENKVKVLQLPTQRCNITACALYRKLGYSIDSSIFIKHYWKNDPF